MKGRNKSLCHGRETGYERKDAGDWYHNIPTYSLLPRNDVINFHQTHPCIFNPIHVAGQLCSVDENGGHVTKMFSLERHLDWHDILRIDTCLMIDVDAALTRIS